MTAARRQWRQWCAIHRETGWVTRQQELRRLRDDADALYQQYAAQVWARLRATGEMPPRHMPLALADAV